MFDLFSPNALKRAVFVLILAFIFVVIPMAIYNGIKKRWARKKGQLIIDGEIDATVKEINRVIDGIVLDCGWKRKNLKKDEELFIEKLRQKRREKIQ